MMKLSFIVTLSVLILFSWNEKKVDKKPELVLINQTSKIAKNEKSFKSYFKIDSLLNKSDADFTLTISNNQKSETLPVLCNCEKNKKDNTIKIQITSGIPTKTELNSGQKGNRILMNLGNPGSFKGQMKTLTFHIKDSLIEKIDLISKSTDNDYGGLGYNHFEVSKYEVNISKMNYAIASNIFGNYKLILPQQYGYFENDTILKGTFVCNNWRINSLDDLKSLDLNKWNAQKQSEMGFQVNQ